MNQEECKTEHPYQPDCETRNIVFFSRIGFQKQRESARLKEEEIEQEI